MQTGPELPAPPQIEHCYRHPAVETLVHCTRCGKPICPECMVPAPVGYQCPDCVAEARREFRQGPGRRIAVANAKALSATKAILAVIVAVYVLEVVVGGPGSLFDGPSATKLYQLGGAYGGAVLPGGRVINPGIGTGQVWRLFTSTFLHAGLIHIAFNAYALWIFGTIVEQELGRLRFVLIYFVTGIFASAVSFAFTSPLVVGVGASGAIFGLFGAFISYNYRRRHLALAAARLRQAFMLIVLNAVIGFTVPGIDWRAHAGGLVGGLAAGYLAEGWGTLSRRKVILVAGFGGLLLAAAALVVWRTATLPALPPRVG